jgi:protein-tyrosine phosphatase
VFRSDALHGLSSADLALYVELGLRSVYDLRGEIERTERPNPMPSRHVPITSRPAGDERASTLNGVTTADGELVLRDVYIGHIEHSAVQIGELFAGLIEPDGLPAVFHCHAGKDRTGMVAALLLETLGVERNEILDDYELTARYRLRAQQKSSYERLIQSGLSPDAAAGVLTTPRWAMASALEFLDDRYQDIGHYLTGPAKMRPGDLDRLCERLLAG